MTKFERAFEIFTRNEANGIDRKATIAEVAATLKVSSANAGVYIYKCVKQAGGVKVKSTEKVAAKQVESGRAPAPTPMVAKERAAPVKQRIVLPKRHSSDSSDWLAGKLNIEPMTEAEMNGTAIPSYVPEFLLNDAQRKIRAKQNAAS
jgi:hypothetical protein